MRTNTPQFLIVDLFCGAGGTTIGFEQSGVSKVIAAVNHDPKAIESHWKNHPEVKHFEEDIRTLDLTELIAHTQAEQAQHPDALLILWASLECTNFSKAKGGQPRDADSRTLADHLHRYITAISPDYVQIENVVEFMSWGPLDDAGKPVSRRNGCDWLRWCAEVRQHGYTDKWTEMNAADFGARTSRNRLFGCFAKPGLPIRWPDATHAKMPQKKGMFGQLKKWEPCRPCLDLDDKGDSIFLPGRIKSDKTFQRIYAGLVKYVAGMSMKEFMVKWRGHKGDNYQNCVSGTDVPSDTITTMNHLGVAQPDFLMKNYSGDPQDKSISTDGPAGTITTVDHHSLVNAEFIVQSNGGSPMGKAKGSNEPCNTITAQDNKALVLINTYYGNSDSLQNADTAAPTITTKDRMGVIQPQWFYKQYSGEDNHQSINEPAGAILPNPKHALVSSEWIDRNFSQGGKDNDVNGPAGSITNVPKMNLVSTEAIIINPIRSSDATSSDNPLGTITASRRHWHYLLNPQHGGHTQGIDRPCPTIIARQDKAPLYLIDVVQEGLAINVLPTDSDTVRNIKAFMAMYGIIDIRMRMLKVMELKKIQGFPEDYELLGTQADQKKFIGNSVCPAVVKAWVLAMAEAVMGVRMAA